jgi:hypothetical protein
LAKALKSPSFLVLFFHLFSFLVVVDDHLLLAELAEGVGGDD